MPRRPATITQAEITRGMKGAMAAGIPFRMTVNPRAGTFEIEPVTEQEKSEENRKPPKPPIVL
jgi:hypothetical protein